MNWKQKICLVGGILIIAAMGICPPWVFRVDLQGATLSKDYGYAPIWEPPERQFQSQGSKYTVKPDIDLSRLYVQWVVAVVVAGGLIIACKDTKPKHDRDNANE